MLEALETSRHVPELAPDRHDVGRRDGQSSPESWPR